jgi:hypothetical protein
MILSERKRGCEAVLDGKRWELGWGRRQGEGALGVAARIDIAVGVGFGGDALLLVLGSGRRGIRFRLGKGLRVLLRNLDGCIGISIWVEGEGKVGTYASYLLLS